MEDFFEGIDGRFPWRNCSLVACYLEWPPIIWTNARWRWVSLPSGYPDFWPYAYGLLAIRPSSHPTIWSSGHPAFWSSSYLVIQTSSHLVFRPSGHLVIWSSDHPAFWSSGHPDFWQSGLLAIRSSDHLIIQSSGLLAIQPSGRLSRCLKNVLIGIFFATPISNS